MWSVNVAVVVLAVAICFFGVQAGRLGIRFGTGLGFGFEASCCRWAELVELSKIEIEAYAEKGGLKYPLFPPSRARKVWGSPWIRLWFWL